MSVFPIKQEDRPEEQPAQTGRSAVLPGIPAAVRMSKELDALVAALEADERRAQQAFEAAKESYRKARQAAADGRQLRALVKVDGAAGSKRWSRKHDACTVCGTTARKHASGGRCVSCDSAHRKAAES